MLEIDSRQGFGMSRPQWEAAHFALDPARLALAAAGHHALLQDLLEHALVKQVALHRGE